MADLFPIGTTVRCGGRRMTSGGVVRCPERPREVVYALVYETDKPRANDPIRNERLVIHATEDQLLAENSPPRRAKEAPAPCSNPRSSTPSANSAPAAPAAAASPASRSPRRRFVPQGGPGLFDQ